ncbi:MAG: hypothetical protein HQM16_02985 [Deltaproteobacteria bacterium]|nr:hypothetical protein [Deltaproteobacteria bacterium]
MKKETKQLIAFFAILGLVLITLKFLNDYVQAQSNKTFKAIKKQYVISGKDKKNNKVNYQHVTDLTEKQKEKSEVVVLNFSGEAQNPQQSNNPDATKEKNDHLKQALASNSEALLAELPDPKTEEKMTAALKQQGQRILSRFVDNEEAGSPHKIQMACDDKNIPGVKTQTNATVPPSAKDPEWRVAKYSKSNIIDKDNYTIEEMSIKFAFKGGEVNGIYNNKYSSTSDLDVTVKNNIYYLAEGAFEGGNGGIISGELKKIDPQTGDLLKDAEPIPFYGKICASDHGFMISTLRENILKSYTLSFPAF